MNDPDHLRHSPSCIEKGCNLEGSKSIRKMSYFFYL